MAAFPIAATGLAVAGGALGAGAFAASTASAGVALAGAGALGAAGIGSAAMGVIGATGLAVTGAALGAGAFGASMASAGVALAGAGALAAGGAAAATAGMALSGAALAGATALAAAAFAASMATAVVALAAAAALTVQSLALMLCFGCTVGYGLGGLGTSSFNNIHWNESSARAGAFLGGAIQVVGILAAFGYVGWTEYLAPFLKTSFIGRMPVQGVEGLTMFGSLEPIGWGLAAIDLISGNYRSAAYGFVTSYFGIPVPLWLLKKVYGPIAGAYNERL
ncbi:MAG: hypothetical protein CVV45_20995 [Spirochaetae bacterium HGW-Spirochaetae-10]|nr:MAG: hypothetical protein CVV45_20995 [Spirochaetae bacterium HGW-Spirochaetae-10]